ncbi:pickpocket protein 28-like [Anopheles ziemanni]|uniref:pickpocket protein 28-like n=1 Tax=Anopheles coustani TaxID=139045 RepID=UPI00265A7154|nr:pickpocket protein 28-like [Anopheles coustani]XP_058170408.1 pickpocket protein 28-like [Anopheles ziemanni]
MGPIRLYSDRAAKFAPKPKEAPIRASEPVGGKPNIFEDYCVNSSIHGFKYFVGSSRTIAEKIWWLVVCIVSIYGCARLINTVYDKWRRNPVVVTFAEQPTPIHDIPFPAVTLCPITKVKTSVLNFTALYLQTVQHNTKHNISEEDYDRFMAMNQVCDFAFSEFADDQTYDDNIVSVLQDIAIPFDEIFVSCAWKNKYVNCSQLFNQALTESGICYTFNSLSADDLLRKEVFHNEFEHLAETRSSENWSMQDGYKPNLGLDTYPRRTLSPGVMAGMTLILKSELADMDYLCGGFLMQLHSPNQCPQISTQHIRIPMHQAVQVRIDPFLISTSENVMSYSPEKRQCFYMHERYLRFFKIYTKRNCELECLANFTLHRCGCVLFSMPRSSGTRLCGIQKLKCCDEADAILQEQGLNLVDNSSRELVSSCNCLPACTFVQFNAEISQADLEWRRLTETINLFPNKLNNSDLSLIYIYFKEGHFNSIKRNQIFGVDDFIANCGGILGLFMGVSLLSIVEILYYFTMKPLINHFFRGRRNAKKVVKVEPYPATTGQYPNNSLNVFLREMT